MWITKNWIKHSIKKVHYEWRKHEGRKQQSSQNLTTQDGKIIDNLRKNGFYKTSLSELALPSNNLLEHGSQEIAHLLRAAPNMDNNKPYESRLTSDQIVDSGILLWGLDRRLLRIARAYLEMPVAYRGVCAKRDVVDDQVMETRLWHQDPEDLQILKIIVYLNDVADSSGPFQCFPRSATPFLNFIPRNRKGRLNTNVADKIARHYPYTTFTGQAGTVIFVDTCAVYHRGKLPTEQDRLVLFYCYNSRKPTEPETCTLLFSKEKFLEKFGGRLTPEQRDCLVEF